MTKLTQEQKLVLGIIYTDRPKWVDHCGHGPHTYVATFESVYADVNKKIVREELDLHVWHGNKICLRFGNEPSEYYSPGTVSNVLRSAHLMESYARVTQILLAMGRIVWVQDKDGTE